MLNIAITGGIGSGKTQAADYLRCLGYDVIDADALSRNITAPGGAALPLIREQFGGSLFNEDGSLSRAAARDMIYRDPVKKQIYEACTTKLVLEELSKIKEESENSGKSIIFYDIPLLFETGIEKEYDIVLVVTADDEIRKKRVRERSGLSDDEFERIMSQQTPESEKMEKADYVIYNNFTIEDMQNAIDEILESILQQNL